MDLAGCYTPFTKNLDVAPTFEESVLTPVLRPQHSPTNGSGELPTLSLLLDSTPLLLPSACHSQFNIWL